jgi:multidrug efflux pump subunit AcrB
MKNLIAYFINRPIVVNALMFGLIIAAVLLWPKIGKEEMPEFSMNWVRVSLRYPGASANDVELFITKPIEEKLKGVSSLKEVTSTSAYGTSSISITFEANLTNLPEKIQEVKDAIDAVDIPREADEPIYRQFRSSEKAIIDIGIFLKDKDQLDIQSRMELQKYALAFKNKILSLPEISGVDDTGYLRPELQIKVDPKSLEKYEISLTQVKNQIVSQNVRRPIGSMKDTAESEVSIISELSDVESMENVIVTAGFQGQKLKLSQMAKIVNGFEQSSTITKVQGREGIIFNIKKSSNVDILSAERTVSSFIKTFKKNNPDSPIDFILIDDESYDVRNRLSLIGSNGLIGFLLILLVLFLFLDFKSGIWVAMGIPFSLAFTLISAHLMGYTINNMTLASIIIVLGIVVDDAIIIAENISRHFKNGAIKDAVASVSEVASPVFASVLTTCAAFVPLYFFSGRFGLFVKYIPLVIFLMLFASIIESFFILPAHMVHKLRIQEFFSKFSFSHKFAKGRESLIKITEDKYSSFLQKILKHRIVILSFFIILLVFSGYIFHTKMKYVMFPREESRDFRLKVIAPEGTTKYQTARMVKKVEDLFLNDNRNIVTSVRTSIGQNRRGGQVTENEASIRVEIVPPSERAISLKDLLKDWEGKAKKFPEFEKIRFQKGWFGSDSGSPIAIQIQEND